MAGGMGWGMIAQGITDMGNSGLGAYFADKQAQKQRDWEQHMYQNRYRMAVKDLYRAGLNPILAAGGLGGGGVPSGASAQAPNMRSTAPIDAVRAGIQQEAVTAQVAALKASSAKDMQEAAVGAQRERSAAAQADMDEERRNIELDREKHDVSLKIGLKTGPGREAEYIGPPGERMEYGPSFMRRRMETVLQIGQAGVTREMSQANLNNALALVPPEQVEAIRNAVKNANVTDLTRLITDVGLTVFGAAKDVATMLIRNPSLIMGGGTGKIGF